MLDFARQASAVGDEIDQTDFTPAHGRPVVVPVEMHGHRVGEIDRAVDDQAGQNLAGEDLSDRADAHRGVTVGRLAGAVGNFAVAFDKGLAILGSAPASAISCWLSASSWRTG